MKKNGFAYKGIGRGKGILLQDILFFILHFFIFFIRGDPYLKAPNAD